MDRSLETKVTFLRGQGVAIPAPESLEIGDEVPLDTIRGPGTVLHAGTKLYGEQLMISPGARIGHEAPATVSNCAVGPRVRLNGGFFADAVFLDDVVLGSGAQIRAGTLMEEQSSGAHTVGLKQTILLPFVTLGSLVNFCDVLMSGGTSRRDHSEVGSSFIHFNFTPFGRNGDKATPSLVGDVPRGVMLRSKRIFLGGQGGLVGPLRIEFGTVLAAGFVYRRDHGPDELVVGEKLPTRTLPFSPLRYSRIRSKVQRNLSYVGNLVALWHWYDAVRIPAAGGGSGATLFLRAQQTIEAAILERVKRLGQVAGYMDDSIAEIQTEGAKADGPEIAAQRAFAAAWSRMEQALLDFRSLSGPQDDARARLLDGVGQVSAADYLELVGGLGPAAVEAGTRWLQGIVSSTEQLF